MSLTGQFVFLERRNPTKEKSSYNDGEYIVVRETPHTLYGVKPVPGYDGARTQAFVKREYLVHDPHTDSVALREFREEQRVFAETPKRGEKLRWVEGVYGDAKNIVRQLDRLCAEGDGTYGSDCPTCGARLKVVVA